MKGSNRSSLAVARYDGSFFKHRERKFLRSCDPAETVSGGLLAIMTIAIIGFILKYRGSPSHNSTKMIPKDQISTLSVYSYFLMSSGAIQAGVPANYCEVVLSLVNCNAYPKSPIFIYPLRLIRILSLFKSRCSCLLRCIASSPLKTSLRM